VAFIAGSSQALLIPVLPLYLESLGASALAIGLMLASFSAASVLFRPAVAVLSERWSTRGVIGASSLLLAACSYLFLVPLVPVTFLVNMIRGVGWGGLNVGGYGFLAQVSPANRRGEASGFFNSALLSVSVVFPAVALALVAAPWAGFGAVFVLAGALGLFAVLVALAIPKPERRASALPDADSGPATRNHFFDGRVVLASSFLLFVYLAQAAMQSFVTLYAREIQVSGVGFYFVASGVAGILSRPLLGRSADRAGYGLTLAIGFVLNVAATGCLVVAHDLVFLALGGVLHAAGSAMVMASSAALAMERAGTSNPGRAMATYSASGQVGNGLGSLIAGAVVEAAGYRSMYATMMAMMVAGLLLALASRRSLQR
jgi:predicted MFS family arabinose efflux permease